MDDEEARRRFTAMYDAHRNQVWAYAVCMADRQRADDLVSETFVVAWRRRIDHRAKNVSCLPVRTGRRASNCRN